MTFGSVPLSANKRTGCCHPEVEVKVPITGRLDCPIAGGVPASEKPVISGVSAVFCSCGWHPPRLAETICSGAGSEYADSQCAKSGDTILGAAKRVSPPKIANVTDMMSCGAGLRVDGGFNPRGTLLDCARLRRRLRPCGLPRSNDASRATCDNQRHQANADRQAYAVLVPAPQFPEHSPPIKRRVQCACVPPKRAKGAATARAPARALAVAMTPRQSRASPAPYA